MKKIVMPLLALMVMLFVSCGDNYYNEEVIKETLPLSYTEYYTVRSQDWQLYDVPPTVHDPDEKSKYTFFYFDLPVPQLTDEVFDYGIMNCYLTNEGNKSIVFPLPYDDFYMNNYMWTEQISCEFSPGNVRFILKYSDFDMNVVPLGYTFMIRFLW